MPEQILLDYNLMMAPRLGGRGIQPERLAAATESLHAAHQLVAEWRQQGRLGFFDLATQPESLERILHLSQRDYEAFDNVVVLGIGGSALGATALREALCPPAWNELDRQARQNRPRLYVLDNIDPTTIAPLLERLDLRRTLFNVVSKSGTTAETMAQFLIVRERLAEACNEEYRRNLIFTTDPDAGLLRRIADDEGIDTLPIPPNVGGRFSVLSAVGLLPAAFVGIDITALLDGARAMDERCRTAQFQKNPAALFALLQFLADSELQAPGQVMMPYSDQLAATADWFRQLWAESLGKRYDLSGNEVFRGPTPIKALGATDQHSQTQLYMEGPFDKTITFLTIGKRGADLEIPNLYPDADALAYLGGHTLGQLLHAEQAATARALAQAGRMNMTIQLPELSAHALGQLLMLFQIATIYAGALYQIDPLDQPGVELGKVLTYALMGRPGYEAPQTPDPDHRWTCP
jgi:glucose-6-phosphate isomerase